VISFKQESTAKMNEMVTERGEVEFIKQMIEESYSLKNKVTLFTTLIGRKSSLKELKTHSFHSSIQFKTTNFTSGRTRRWFLAWWF